MIYVWYVSMKKFLRSSILVLCVCVITAMLVAKYKRIDSSDVGQYLELLWMTKDIKTENGYLVFKDTNDLVKITERLAFATLRPSDSRFYEMRTKRLDFSPLEGASETVKASITPDAVLSMLLNNKGKIKINGVVRQTTRDADIAWSWTEQVTYPRNNQTTWSCLYWTIQEEVLFGEMLCDGEVRGSSKLVWTVYVQKYAYGYTAFGTSTKTVGISSCNGERSAITGVRMRDVAYDFMKWANLSQSTESFQMEQGRRTTDDLQQTIAATRQELCVHQASVTHRFRADQLLTGEDVVVSTVLK